MNIKPTVKEYPGPELTILWQAHKCIHSERCWRNLPGVFRYGQKPWVKPDGAAVAEVQAQIEQCPSGALSYKGQNLAGRNAPSLATDALTNGPLWVKGKLKLTLANGEQEEVEHPLLCRCGASGNKPLCDGSHQKVGFKG
jgi:uncharacterized Fe-S cluster protein YjdI